MDCLHEALKQLPAYGKS